MLALFPGHNGPSWQPAGGLTFDRKQCIFIPLPPSVTQIHTNPAAPCGLAANKPYGRLVKARAFTFKVFPLLFFYPDLLTKFCSLEIMKEKKNGAKSTFKNKQTILTHTLSLSFLPGLFLSLSPPSKCLPFYFSPLCFSSTLICTLRAGSGYFQFFNLS